LSGDFAPADYKTVKIEYDEKINRLEVKLNTVTTQTTAASTIGKLLSKAVVTLPDEFLYVH
jgi:hypothetical protein